jgi:hypothetical protein
MKKLLFFWSLTLSTCTLSAQDYIPLMQEQATWVIWQWCGVSLECCDLFGYRIEGDTMIEGTAYKKVYRLEFFIDQYPFNPYRKSGQVLFGAIREDLDERRVYARIFESGWVGWYCNDPGPEKLWYDFSLEVGDTLPSCIHIWTSPINAIDTAFSFGEDRRRWSVIGEAGYVYQVEGLGTGTGLFDPEFGAPQSGESSYTLEHYCIGSEADCGIIDATSVRELALPASTISIAPNPASGLVRISLKGQEGGIEGISLYSPSGQLLREWVGNQGVDVSDLTPGLYWVRVRTSKGAGFGKLVKH